MGNHLARTQDGFNWPYAYDALDRLTAIAKPATPPTMGWQASYVYDGAGLGLQETVYGATTSFAWDLAAGVPQLVRASGPTATHDYVSGLGLAVQVGVSGQDAVTLYPLSDAVGSVRPDAEHHEYEWPDHADRRTGRAHSAYTYNGSGHLLTAREEPHHQPPLSRRWKGVPGWSAVARYRHGVLGLANSW